MYSPILTFKGIAKTHDQSPAFHATYMVLTVLIAAMLNLGAFLVLIVAHMALDTVKYREVHGMRWKHVARGVVRESLVDVVLLILGLTSVVYLHHEMGLAAASGLLRAQATLLNGLILVATKSRILFDILCVVSALPSHMQQVAVHPRKPWSAFECFCFGVLGTCTVLLLVLPTLVGLPTHILPTAIQAHMVPWHI